MNHNSLVVVIIMITVNTDILPPYLSTRSALLPLVDALLHSNHLFNSGIFNEPGSLEPKEAPDICSSFNCFRKVKEVEELLEGLLEFIIVQQSINTNINTYVKSCKRALALPTVLYLFLIIKYETLLLSERIASYWLLHRLISKWLPPGGSEMTGAEYVQSMCSD